MSEVPARHNLAAGFPATKTSPGDQGRDKFRGRLALALAFVLALPGCGTLTRGFLAPAGPIAAAERHEFIIVGAILLLVIGPVLLLTPIIAWHYRLSNTKSAFRPEWGFSWILEGLIWIPPTMIVVVLSIFLCWYTERLDPYRRLSSPLLPLEVQAVSLDWKWLFIYPEQHIAAVNELILPVGRPVHFSLTSGTVMQSFLLPKLAGQIFTMAGMTTQLNLAVSKPGTYWGENAQFNGTGFQAQKLQVIGVSPANFSRWVTTVQQTPNQLNDKAYQSLSRKSILSNPVTFGSVEPNLFSKIVKQAITSGYIKSQGKPQ
jgi:cytochrome o ubiquinol oxidase subunit 2